ncbi:protoglobin domain-containing protein [Wohlfahrtiimonas chitiniclastica]|uniref:protoglobin domain-containing protein n=1 Tax=Wohlfahrtiimonas chitiniclastica TaxID=400946 RepID=UPI0003608DE7|nr:protoglobin domain-containing protein [Wohlfahrtiimonas chitiniclastica]
MSIKNTFGITNEDLDVLLDINHFTQADVEILRTLQPLVLPKLGQLTEQFYAQLQGNETTAHYLEGRIDALKATHLAWLQGLFTENFDQTYVDFLWNIGRVHAKLHIAPLFVAASMSYLRAEFPKLITREDADALGHLQSELISPVLKMLDINQFVIDSSYSDRLLEVTGISKKLLQRLMG